MKETSTYIFNYIDYKSYLNDKVSYLASKKKAVKQDIAIKLSCDKSYISKVLKSADSKINFSLEQAININRYFNHSIEESRYFINMIQYAKAQDDNLKFHFYCLLIDAASVFLVTGEEIEHLSVDGNMLREYTQNGNIPAVHMLLQLENYSDISSLCKAFSCSKSKMKSILNFLIKNNYASFDGKKYKHLPLKNLKNSNSGYQIDNIHRLCVENAINKMSKSRNCKVKKYTSKNISMTIPIAISDNHDLEIYSLFMTAIREVVKLSKHEDENNIRAEVCKIISLSFFDPFNE